MNRRQAITSIGLGGAGFVATAAFEAPACNGPSVEAEVAIAQTVISALKTLFPNTPILDKVAKLFSDFNADWVAGKFDSARALFDNLDAVVGQVINDLGVNASTRVKLLLTTLGVVLRAVAALIKAQGQANPAIAARAQSIAPQTVNRINQLTDPSVVDKLFAAIKP